MIEHDALIRAIGEDAMDAMDLLDEDLVGALNIYIPALNVMVRALSGWDARRRTQMLAALAINAGMDENP